MKKSAKFTIKKFNEKFPNDDACLQFIFEARWPNGVFCPKCQRATKHYKKAGIKFYACEFCGNGVAPLSGTIFHKSDTSLRSWFYAMFLMSQTRCGISAKQLERELGVTYKTAWRMFKQIRSIMTEDFSPMNGTIEADETYVGGKHAGPGGRGALGKTPVAGLAHRDEGHIVAKVVPDVKARTLMPVIWDHVPRDAKNTIYTDELASYNYVQKLGYTHKIVTHAKHEYARGDVHVNTVEGFWSLVKRGIDGVYHAVSPKYLQTYLNEYGFRYNHRKSGTPMFSLVLNQVSALAPATVVQPSAVDSQMRLW
jgi:transposase